MRVAVAFPMPPFPPVRYDAAEKGRHVPAHIGIGPFIDRQAAGRMRAKQCRNAVPPAFFPDHGAKAFRDVHHLLPVPGDHRTYLHRKPSLAPPCTGIGASMQVNSYE